MKHTFRIALCLVLAVIFCAFSVSALEAGETVYFCECEDGEITGAAKEYKDGNIQDVGIASNGQIVGLGGVNDAPQLASTVTFPNFVIPEDGIYDITFRYDTDASDEKKADIMVDGHRYAVAINMAELPEQYGVEFRDFTLSGCHFTAGEHTLAVTTSEDFNRDAEFGPIVKSVNADYIEVKYVGPLPVDEAPVEDTDVPAEEVPADDAPAAEAPVTADAGIAAAVLAFAAAAVVLAKRK